MPKIKFVSGGIFILLVMGGLWIASQRPLWNDEYYSLISSVINISYSHILGGGVNEGNNSPLFYTLQKFQCDLFSYHPPQEWMRGHWTGNYPYDWAFLRIQAVVFMAMAVSSLFYYFARRNSWGMGIYAIAVTLTSSLFWFHWTEARPYALWFSLGLFQILILLKILENPEDLNEKNLIYLFFLHCFLALVSVVSIVQIISAGIVLWMFHRPRLFWYGFLILIPLGICIFYYMHAPHYDFFFVDGPIALINANIPKDRLLIIFMTAGILIFQCRGKNLRSYLEIKYLVFFVLMLGAFGVILLKMKCSQTEAPRGFQISSRYFLSLLPAGIVGTVLFSEYFFRAFLSRTWKVLAILILAVFLAFRFYKTSSPININLNAITGHGSGSAHR